MEEFRLVETKKHKKPTDRIKVNANFRTYYKEHKDKYNNRHTDPRYVYNTIKHSSKVRSIEINITREEFITWYNNQPKVCSYCKRPEEVCIKDILNRRKHRRLNIDRINNNKGYELDNICLACNVCNAVKGKFISAEQMIEIGKTIAKESVGVSS